MYKYVSVRKVFSGSNPIDYCLCSSQEIKTLWRCPERKEQKHAKASVFKDGLHGMASARRIYSGAQMYETRRPYQLTGRIRIELRGQILEP